MRKDAETFWEQNDDFVTALIQYGQPISDNIPFRVLRIGLNPPPLRRELINEVNQWDPAGNIFSIRALLDDDPQSGARGFVRALGAIGREAGDLLHIGLDQLTMGDVRLAIGTLPAQLAKANQVTSDAVYAMGRVFGRAPIGK